MRLQYTIGIPTGHVKLNHSHVCGEVLSIHCGMEDIFDRNQAESHTRAQVMKLSVRWQDFFWVVRCVVSVAVFNIYVQEHSTAWSASSPSEGILTVTSCGVYTEYTVYSCIFQVGLQVYDCVEGVTALSFFCDGIGSSIFLMWTRY